VKTVFRWLLSLFVVAAGIGHFVKSEDFIRMVPAMLPAPALLVYISGVAEIAGGVGLQIARTRKWAALGLILLFIAVFPANINMAIHHISPTATPMEPWKLWARLPLQFVLIAWAWWVRKP
jgi:uncharacterized membrane protein